VIYILYALKLKLWLRNNPVSRSFLLCNYAWTLFKSIAIILEYKHLFVMIKHVL